MRIFCISQNQEILDSLERYFKFTLPIKEEKKGKRQLLKKILVSSDNVKDSCYLFQYIYRQVLPEDEFKCVECLRGAIGIIDLGEENIEDLNPTRKGTGWASVVAMLVLAFPEIHWIFISPQDCFKIKNELKELKSHFWDIEKGLKKWKELFFCTDYTPLFDPFGLRDFIKEKINENKETKNLIPYLRKHFAVSIDEEPASAYMNAYVAYRFGFKTLAITKENLMKWSLKEKGNYEPDISLEDIFLSFPDKKIDRLSDIENRDKQFPVLKNIKHRFLITVGHKKGTPLCKNKRYLRYYNDCKFKVIYKPISGIYPLKEELKLTRLKIDNERYVKNFLKSYKKIKTIQEKGGTHSSPGRLLTIAGYLIQRAEILLNDAITVEDAIHGAVLALEGKELLGYRTPTISMEALALQHQLEVLAECMFYGVEYHFDVKERVKEIQKEISIIGEWFNPHTSECSELNATLSIVGHLINIFRRFTQFDEELECLHFLRKLHRKLLLKRSKSFILLYPIVAYIEKLITSLPLFIIALIGWPTLWGILYYICYRIFHESCWENMSPTTHPLFTNIVHSFFAFFGSQPILAPHGYVCGILCIAEVIWGFIHLGIFISYIFDLIMRK